MLTDLAKMAKIHKFGLLHSPMATWLTLTGTLSMYHPIAISTALYEQSTGPMQTLIITRLGPPSDTGQGLEALVNRNSSSVSFGYISSHCLPNKLACWLTTLIY